MSEEFPKMIIEGVFAKSSERTVNPPYLMTEYKLDTANSFPIVIHGQEAHFELEYLSGEVWTVRFPKRFSRKKRKLLRAKWNQQRKEYFDEKASEKLASIIANEIIEELNRPSILRECFGDGICVK